MLSVFLSIYHGISILFLLFYFGLFPAVLESSVEESCVNLSLLGVSAFLITWCIQFDHRVGVDGMCGLFMSRLARFLVPGDDACFS